MTFVLTFYFMVQMLSLLFAAWLTHQYRQGQLHTIPRFATGCLVAVGWRDMAVLIGSLGLFTLVQALWILHAVIVIRALIMLTVMMLWLWFFKRHKYLMIQSWIMAKIHLLKGSLLTIVFAIPAIVFVLNILLHRFHLSFFGFGLMIVLLCGITYKGHASRIKTLEWCFLTIVGCISLIVLG